MTTITRPPETGERARSGPRPPTTNPSPSDAPRRSSRRVWWSAVRYHLRLVRRQALAWAIAIVAIGAGLTSGFNDLYPTAADREAMARSIEGVPAFEALAGRTVELGTVEGFILWRWGGFAFIFVAVWGMLASVKLLRGAEDAGHYELLRAGTLGPRGLVTSVMAALGIVYGLTAVAIGITHAASGLDPATAWAFGAAIGLTAALFAALGALASQLGARRRTAVGLVGAVLGVSIGIRVIAASSNTPDWMWWVSPFGWVTHLHEVEQSRPVVLGLLALTTALLALGATLTARRDLHAGRIGDGDETVTDARPVGGHLGLARTLVRATAITWAAILLISSLVFGLLARDFATAMVDLPDTVAMAAQIGMVGIDTTAGVVGALVGGFLILVVSLFAVSLGSAIREEEASWRIEHLLVRPLGRTAWLVGRVVTAAAAIVVLALASGLIAWVGTAITGDAISLGEAFAVGANMIPLPLAFLGVTVALVGIAPRHATGIGFGLVIGTYVLDIVGGLMDLPRQVLELGPFRHIAAAPVEAIAITPTAVMLLVAIGAATLGAIVFRRRDLREA